MSQSVSECRSDSFAESLVPFLRQYDHVRSDGGSRLSTTRTGPPLRPTRSMAPSQDHSTTPVSAPIPMSLPLKALNAPPDLTTTPSPHRAMPLQGYKLKPQHGYLEIEWGYQDNAAWLLRERRMVTTKSPINLIQWVIKYTNTRWPST